MSKAVFDMDEAKAALSKVAAAQEAFWQALYEFERVIDHEIDGSTRDFTQYSDPSDEDVYSFIEENDEEESQ